MRTLSSLVAVASLGAAGLVAVAVAAPAAAVPSASRSVAATPTTTSTTPGSYVPVSPTRVVDTRVKKPAGPLLAGRTIKVAVGKTVPAGARAVAVTISVVSPTWNGAITAWQAGTSRPVVSNVQYLLGKPSSDAAIVPLSSTGTMEFYNQSTRGRVQLVVDVSGYYRGGTVPKSDQGLYHSVTPKRIVDTRPGAPIAANDSVTPSVGNAGRNLALTITVLKPARAGRLFAYPGTTNAPAQTDIHFVAGQTVSSFSVVTSSSAGRILLFNSSGASLDVVVDLAGYFGPGPVLAAGATQPVDTHRAVDASKVAPAAVKSVKVAGIGGVPRTNLGAVLVRLTVGSPRKSGGVTAWAGRATPNVTNLLFAAGQTVSGAATVAVSTAGTIDVRNASSGSLQLWVDIVGYVPSSAITPPPPSVSRYLGDLTENVSDDEATMQTHGCDDGAASSTFVLLDVGAQSITGPELSKDDPGVAIALATPTVRLHYADLVTVVGSYLNSFKICAPTGLTPTIAVGTNNSGAYSGPTAYPAPDRGTAWADQVVDSLAAAAPAGVTIVGANDIENGNPETDGFDNDVTNAQRWETAYLAATDSALVYNGSANGCPTTFGARGGSCADGWTEEEFYGLAHSGNRISVLPQVYFEEQAVQWANINATGDATGKGALIFAGSLTEHAVDPSTFTPAAGWAALVRALSTVVPAPTVPAATDIRVG